MEKVTLKIEGMSCEHCANAVTLAIAGIDGISELAVDLRAGTASFNYNPAIVPLETIKAAITEEGYTVE